MVNFTAKIIRESGMALVRTSNSFFDLESIYNQKLRLQNIDFVVSTLVWDVVKSYQKNARERKVSLGLTTSDDVMTLMVHMDEVRVRQLLDALIFDAVQSAEAWSSIHVDLALNANKTHWVLTVAPSDIPIDGVDLRYAFWATSNYKLRLQAGPGIELALTKELIALLGGTVTYQIGRSEAPRLCVLFDLKRTRGRL
jgi:K+-sensing histidine kinase KdpD